ncbi:CENPM [Mytilus coruscus]|uniref:Centromere protein M n=1 Tax=Mytilus coruscus TaxID=42192 RepID=A0A6J8A013_MYTCO|nr:CENPM [Mytilus coruscus]
MTATVLKPHNKLPQFNTVTVLLVGAEGTGKHELAKGIISIDEPFSVQIRTATCLPLSTEDEESRPRIDFICFIVDLTNRESMRVVEESVKHIDLRYFLGRSCFVALKVKCPEKRGVGLELVSQFCDHYGAPILYGALETDQEKITLAKQVLNMAKVSAGLVNNISPLLIDSTRRPYDTQLL